MIRNLAVAGGRQLKNEDLTQYIQSFSILEQIFSGLGYGNYIVYGCIITGSDVSSGVIYLDGELSIFAGTSAVTFPLKLSKNVRGIDPREFSDTVTRDTAQIIEAIPDALGLFELTSSTPRITDRFLRNVNNTLLGNIDGNVNGALNVHKPLLSDRIISDRVIPKPTSVNKYLKIGTFPIGITNGYNFHFSGLGANFSGFSVLSISKHKNGTTDNLSLVNNWFISTSSNDNRPIFGLYKNTLNGVYELWVKSPSALPDGDFTEGLIKEFGKTGSDNADVFTFESSFIWQSHAPNFTSIQNEILASQDFVTNITNDIISDVVALHRSVGKRDLISASGVTLIDGHSYFRSGVLFITAKYRGGNKLIGQTVLLLHGNMPTPDTVWYFIAGDNLTAGVQNLRIDVGTRAIVVEIDNLNNDVYTFSVAIPAS